jgi:gliding motility-associated-like protein
MANHSDPENADGYFLQLGESGSEDVPELFFSENGEITSVVRCSGPDIHSSFSLLFRVVRNKYGFWSVGIINESHIYEETGTGFHDQISQSAWFIFQCKCTSSNTNNFFFDDIVVRNTYFDKEPPEAWEVSVASSNKLTVKFSEPIEAAGASQTTNYSLSPGEIIPVGAGVIPGNEDQVQLLFGNNFIDGCEYSLRIANLGDPAGNIMEPVFLWFKYHELKVGSIIISEVMADINPVPPGLPPFEYVELCNTTDHSINLDQFRLLINSREYLISGNYTIQGGEYMVLTDNPNPLWQNAVFIDGLSVPNSSCRIVLCSAEGEPVHWIWYEESLHDSSKEDGGWSLEIVDVTNINASGANVSSSVDERGGTPAAQNSISGNNPDLNSPYISHASLITGDTVRVYFNEPVRFENSELPFILDPPFIIEDVELSKPWDCAVTLSVFPSLQVGEILELYPTEKITDYAGNMCRNDTVKVAFAEVPDSGDVIINEILFDPEEGFHDYVELYNQSAKVVNLSSFSFAGYDTLIGEACDIQGAIDVPLLLFPDDYVLITRDTAGYSKRYPSAKRISVALGDFLPLLPNEEGALSLISFSDSRVVDFMTYNSSMHYPVLYSAEGVSLERVDAGIWHSSGELNGFGTPGYKNSQSLRIIESPGSVLISPKVITPDNDGRDDVATIKLQCPDDVESADVFIFDQYGYRIKVLSENIFLSDENTIVWDGTNENGKIVSPGYYVIVASYRNRFGLKPAAKASIAVGL